MAPPLTIDAGPVFVTARSASGLTFSVALAATTLGPMLVVRPPAGIVFTCAAPGVDDVTTTVTTHVPLAGTVPPVSVTLLAVKVATPPAHVVAGALKTVKPNGKLSVTEVTVIAAPLLLPMVMVSVEFAPGLIAVGA